MTTARSNGANGFWKTAAIVLFTAGLSSIVILINALGKPNRSEVKQIVADTVDYPWLRDKPLVEQFMENTNKSLDTLDGRQQKIIQDQQKIIQDVSNVGAKVDILLERTKP